MKIMKRRASAALLLFAATVMVVFMFQGKPLFARAIVVPGPCFFDDNAGSLWEGQGNFTLTGKGRINGICHASLVSGPGVTQTTFVQFIGGTPFGPAPYSGYLEPSGQAQFIAHN